MPLSVTRKVKNNGKRRKKNIIQVDEHQDVWFLCKVNAFKRDVRCEMSNSVHHRKEGEEQMRCARLAFDSVQRKLSKPPVTVKSLQRVTGVVKKT